MRIIWLLTILLSYAATSGAQSKTSRIESLMQNFHRNNVFNGTILVADNGKIVYNKAFGYADFITKEPLTIHSAFYLASVSKQFTAMAIMMLKEQGKLSYSDKLSEYFPQFPEYANNITIKHLLNHTSGLPDYYDLGIFREGITNHDVFETLVRQMPEFNPGEKYVYCNSGYVLLAMIVERITGNPFGIFVKENIFEPLGMKSTVVCDESVPEIKKRATGFNASGEKDDYHAFTTGGGGMYSTTNDLFLWDQALYTDKLVQQPALKEAYEPAWLNNDSVAYYGFGWMIKKGSEGIIYHTGTLAGFKNYIYRDIKYQHTIILLTNHGAANAIDEISDSIQSILYDY